jgi:hypothetical protein
MRRITLLVTIALMLALMLAMSGAALAAQGSGGHVEETHFGLTTIGGGGGSDRGGGGGSHTSGTFIIGFVEFNVGGGSGGSDVSGKGGGGGGGCITFLDQRECGGSGGPR